MKYEPYLSYQTTFNGQPLFAIYPATLHANVLNLSDAALEEIQKSWENTKTLNSEMYTKNCERQKEVKARIEELFKEIGIKTYKRSSGFKIIGEYKEFKECLRVIAVPYPASMPFPNSVKISDSDVYRSPKSPVSLTELVAGAKSYVASQKSKEAAHIIKLQQVIALAPKYGIAIDDPELLEKVTAADRNAWVQENYPDDTEIDHSCCDECSTWTVGERRCSCGGRRLYLEVDGDIGSWYAYACAD